MEYDAKTKRMKSTKIFTDVSKLLAKLYRQKIDLADAVLKPQMTELIKNI